jgi:hypothetical protein
MAKKRLVNGIAGGQEQGDDGQLQHQTVERQDQQKRHQRQPACQQQGLTRRYLARCQGAVAGAFHVRIEFTVGIVVDDATGRAHQHHPRNEYCQYQPIRSPLRRQPLPP